MTKLRIDGVEYDVDQAVEEMSTGTIKAMAKQSALYGEPVTLDYLEQNRVRIEAMRADPDVSELAVSTDVGSLDMLTAYIFIVKRHAGEQITWGEAEKYPPGAIEQIDDDESEVSVEAPKDESALPDVQPESSETPA